MSLRYTGAWMQDGAFNPLTAPAPIYQNELWSWGANGNGQLGLGNTTAYSSPKQVGVLSDWLSITGFYYTAAAIKRDGTLWSWGNNTTGQVGVGNTTNYSSPKQIGSLTTWRFITLSTSGFAIKTDGTLWAWGSNNVGQLGLGDATNRSSPIQVGSLTNWLQVSCGAQHLAAIKTDGTLWTCGYNQFGQLGLGDTTNRSSPTQVGALTNWSKVSNNNWATLAIKTDGTLWSWGYGTSYGMLGLGNTTNYSSPKQVGALTNWLQVACGGYFIVSVKTDGTLWSWGANYFGALGLGNTTYYSSPKQVGSLATWSYVSAAGPQTTAAIKSDKTLWAWGANGNGQLGLGNATNYSSPKQVGALTTWLSVSGGRYNMLALKY